MFDAQKMADWLATRPDAAKRALFAIYGQQTAAEKAGEHTNELNGVGFNKFDAPIASAYVKWFERNPAAPLPAWRHAKLVKMMTKYRRQLADLANDRAAKGITRAQRPQRDQSMAVVQEPVAPELKVVNRVEIGCY